MYLTTLRGEKYATADWPATDRAEGEGVRKFLSFWLLKDGVGTYGGLL